MKLFAVLAALAWAGIANAQTIVTLQPETCSATQVCINVPNDKGVAIEYISDASQYRRLLIEVDGDVFDSGLWGAPDLSAFTLYDGAGRVLTGSLELTITHGPKCVQEGRVCVFPKSVTLNGGVLVLP